ncbi:MAG: hypothetical protein Q9M18_07100 [Mariprofundaceae bacterium]|nr:hypothetical protein [Mariprofundaceae bacterium]
MRENAQRSRRQWRQSFEKNKSSKSLDNQLLKNQADDQKGLQAAAPLAQGNQVRRLRACLNLVQKMVWQQKTRFNNEEAVSYR